MGSNMEGNWQLLQPHAAEKPIVIKGTQHFKRTFPFHPKTEELLISGAVSVDEVQLQQSSGQFTGIKLMRGLWREKQQESSGTYFPVAAPVGEDVMWCSAGHCLMPNIQRQWRCGYATEVLSTSPSSRLENRSVVDLGWLARGRDPSELAEVTPSEPVRPIIAAEVTPHFGFMFTRPLAPSQLFIPCARQLKPGEAVCLLGFAHRPTGDWCRTFLRTEADYEQALEAATRHNETLSPNWQLDPYEALDRSLDLLDDVCHPSRLVAAPGLVAAASQRIIEHTCSTFPGMSGAPGVDVHSPWKLLFVHTRADNDFRRNNYGYSVHHPLFAKAYMREVLPQVLKTPAELLSPEKVQCLLEYLDAHKAELPDRSLRDQLVQRC